jgi:hypothetical protein
MPSISGQRLTRFEASWAESIRWLVVFNKVYATASHKARRLTNLILGSRPHLQPIHKALRIGNSDAYH